ncbi:MAG TPA: ABC transporter permease [Syntrophomonas sp.]|jgi:putative ABC transport system permease protein|nr:ABC transporter permease [Syntrophomonas sp.]
MNFLESIRVALESIRSNMMRSILTTVGIVIGIAAVIAIVAIGQGGKATLMQEMEKIGSNLFAVYPDWRKDEPTTGKEFALEDVRKIKEQVPQIKYMAAYAGSYESIRGGKKTKSARITGTEGDHAFLQSLEMLEGRFFSKSDESRRVAAIDEALAEELFGRKDVLGERVVVNGNSFAICGVIKDKGSFLMGESKYLYIPIRAWLDMYPDGVIDSLQGSTYNGAEVETAMDQTIKILERRHRAKDLYAGETLAQQMEMASKVTSVLTLIIGAIAGISLLVGGIGVMNIMLVSVTERTREIGLRMALGARRRDIMTQFLIEAVMLCVIGGVIGMILGVGGAYLIAKLAKWPPLVSWATILLAFAFSAGIGIIFGLLPASKASNLDPIEALRHD